MVAESSKDCEPQRNESERVWNSDLQRHSFVGLLQKGSRLRDQDTKLAYMVNTWHAQDADDLSSWILTLASASFA